MTMVLRRIFILCVIFFPTAFVAPIPLTIKEIPGMYPVSIDLPPDWTLDKSVKNNGVIYTLRKGNSQIEIRNFILPEITMDYIINAKAARLHANFAYVNLLIEKTRNISVIIEKTIFWKMVSMSKPYYEKTVIQKYDENIIIVSCGGPEEEYQKFRVIFENAFLSIAMNIQEKVEPPKVEEIDTEKIIKSLTDERDDKGDKSDKLMEPEEIK
jgi:hypothetical protein